MIKSVFGAGKTNDDIRTCVNEAVKDFKDPKLIMFFSDEKNFKEYGAIIHEMFPNAVSIGSTSYRLWGPSVTPEDTLKVMSIEDGIICAGGVIENADNHALSYMDNVRRCMEEVGTTKDTVCVEFCVPFKRAEEYALMALNSVLLRNGIDIVGGTAASGLIEGDYNDKAYISLNGTIYPNGCVFVIIHNLGGRIYIRHENIYEPLTGEELITTKANNVTRTVLKYNELPAAEVYARQLGVPQEEISKHYFYHPIGRYEGKETFLTAILGEGVNGSMKHLASIHEGTHVMVMKVGDFKRITEDTIKQVKEETPNPSLVLMFNCTARTILFEQTGYIDEYMAKLAEAFPNYIGSSCNGEQHGTKQLNHTLTMAVFE